jgi:hypothetical protein
VGGAAGVDVMSNFSVLSPYQIPPELSASKVPNLGDGFILRAIERLVGGVDTTNVFSPRVAPSSEALAAMARCGTVLLGGANQLNDQYRIWPGFTAEGVRKSRLRFVPFGVGIHGKPDKAATMSDETKAVIEAIHERAEFSSWRCPRTIAYLGANLPALKDRFLLTGCPVIFGEPLLESSRFHDKDDVVAVTVTERGGFWERETASLRFVGRQFPRSKKILVIHQDYARRTGCGGPALQPIEKLHAFAHQLGFSIVTPANIDEGAAVYDGVDIHFGSRLHAHLTVLSRNKRSYVVGVDDRARGMAELFDFPLCDPLRFESYLDFDFERVRTAAQRTYPILQKFLRSLQ